MRTIFPIAYVFAAFVTKDQHETAYHALSSAPAPSVKLVLPPCHIIPIPATHSFHSVFLHEMVVLTVFEATCAMSFDNHSSFSIVIDINNYVHLVG